MRPDSDKFRFLASEGNGKFELVRVAGTEDFAGFAAGREPHTARERLPSCALCVVGVDQR